MFENIDYGSYPQHSDLNNLTIEYKQRLFTKRPIDFCTNNSVEMLKVSLIEQFLDNRRYKSNPQNADFNVDLQDGDYIIYKIG